MVTFFNVQARLLMAYLMKFMFTEVVVRLPNQPAGLGLLWLHYIGGDDDIEFDVLSLCVNGCISFKLTWMKKNLSVFT